MGKSDKTAATTASEHKGSGIITDEAMRARPGATDVWLIEPGVRGDGRLVGRITPAGERRWYYRYTGTAGQIRLLIGPYGPRGDGQATYTVKQAREVARGWSALYRGGIRDLREHFAAERADAAKAAEQARREAAQREQDIAAERERRITLRKLFERWCAVELAPHNGADGKRMGRKDGGQYTAEQFERRVFPALGERAVAEIRKADLLAILDAVKAEGKLRTANVLLTDLKQMFRFALAREIVERNPLDTVTKRDAGGASAMRERNLSAEEIAELARSLPKARLNPRSAVAVWLLLATGARIGELMGATWADARPNLQALAALPAAADVKVGIVDLLAGTWHLPTTKNERDHTIHLSDFARAQFEVLAGMRAVRVDEFGVTHPVPWVFPNHAQTGPVCVKSFGKQLSDRQREPERRMQNRAKSTQALALPGGRWTAHDLRRTAGNLMARLGISGDVIDECLNHVIESRVRRTYIQDRRPVEQARAFDALGTKLESIITGKAADSNVRELRAA